jgi:glycerol kinase
MQKYVLAIDQGTTGTTALLFDEDLRILGKATVDFPQYFPQPGWVEHDLNEIWNSVLKAVKTALQGAKVNSNSIAAIGITNQRETTCLWERGEQAQPLRKAIVWQDRRTAAECEELRKKGLSKKVQMKTGLALDPYFSATKLQWMLKNTPERWRGPKRAKCSLEQLNRIFSID